MIFFSNWESLLRIPIIGLGAYVGLIIILRISGNRTLSKMNSFDFIITIALGSTFASAILDKSIALLDTLLAFAVLTGLQFTTTWLTVRSKKINELVKSRPVLLYWNNDYLDESMKKAHITKSEVLAGMREQGFSSLDEVGFVVLEANGKIVAARKGDASTFPQ